MRITTIVIIIIAVGFLLFYKAPDIYSKTYGIGIEKGTNFVSGFWTKSSDEELQPLHQDVGEDGNIVEIECGKIFGLPYDTFKNGDTYKFSCTTDANCYTRYTSASRCNVNTGECYQAC